MERLFINGQECDLTAGNTDFTRTLQANDIANLSNRQSNFSKNIKVPFTPNNEKIFGYLRVMGTQSQFPYLKNTCDLFYNNDKIINNGWTNITKTTDKGYELHVYDGTVDLWKAIENKTLGDLDVSGITHTKTIASVISTWQNDFDYQYILADYGGKTIFSGDIINIDYQIPSVKVSYLWNRIFETYGFTYTGSIFESDDFQNLWMTYPKGVTPENNDNIIPITSFSGGNTNYNKGGVSRFILNSSGYTDSYATIIQSPTSFQNGYGTTNEHVKVLTNNNKYNIKISGKINATNAFNLSQNVLVDLWFVKNCQGFTSDSALAYAVKERIAENISVNHNLEVNYNFTLAQNETFSIVATSVNGTQNNFTNGTNFLIDFGRYGDPLYDFQNELKDFNINDFVKEIIWRYGLTIYEDSYTTNYDFRTLDEVINNPVVVDWSSKFQSVSDEKYIYNSYGQKNAFKYKYNEDNANHNDGYLLINNLNLDEKKDVIQSKIYSPESDTVNLTELSDVHIYKIWDKEPKDDGTLKYKGLNKKYYFIKSETTTFSTPQKVGSEVLSGYTTVTEAKTETYSGIGWDEVIQNFYSPLRAVLDSTKILNTTFWLTPNDIASFDFRKLYYIEQLGGSFLINKITNYRVGKPVQVELVKINK